MPDVTVCYDGGGWTIPYLLGVTEALQREEEGVPELAFAGVSSGACVALAAALGVPMAQLMSECLAWSHLCRACPVLTVTAVRSICRGRLEAFGDASATLERLRGRFAAGVSSRKVGVTAGGGGGRDLELQVVSSFGGIDDVVAAVAGSCTVPFVNTLPPLQSPLEKRLGYLDGVLTAHFFEPPWASDRVVGVSAVQGRAGAAVACPKRLPLTSGVIPMTESRLVDLWDLGVADGPRLRRALGLSGGGRGGRTRAVEKQPTCSHRF